MWRTDTTCSKLLRRSELYSDGEYVKSLKDELGDVYAMIDLMAEWDVVSWTDLDERRMVKRKKLSKWSDLCQDEE